MAALRALPFLALALWPPPPGVARVAAGYNPKDWLAYAALVRQPADSGRWLLANPFTTEPQEGRFVLLYHQALGALHAATGIAPLWLLELSRVLLLLLFFAVLWRFLWALLGDARRCLWAAALVALSGGLEPFVLPLARAFAAPESLRLVEQELWHLYGWNTFAAAYNPLWLAALALLLPTLRRLLQPGGPRGGREVLGAGAGLLLLGLTHSYSLILALAAVAGVAFAELALAPAALRARLLPVAAAMAVGLLPLAGLAAWQLADPVFRASAGGLLGPQASSPFWFPVTFGLVGLLALRGWRLLAREAHPWRLVLPAWFAAVALLASSPLLNGYHFVYGLHLPLCVAAAPALAEAWRAVRASGSPRRWLVAAAAAVLLFASPLAITRRSLVEAPDAAAVNLSTVRAVGALARLPPTRVLSPPEVGNVLPAYTPHRVWVGHWFMTPSYVARASWYAQLVARPEEQAPQLRALVAEHELGAVVVPAVVGKRVAAALGGSVTGVLPCGDLVVLRLGAG